MRVRSLGGKDPLEKEMTTHSNILAWEIPLTEEPGGLQSMEFQESDMTKQQHYDLETGTNSSQVEGVDKYPKRHQNACKIS